MKNSITLLLLLCSIICLVPKANGAEYYWVGNGGAWNDITHWVSEMGVAHTVLPGPDDNVYFNANSFDTDGQVVQLIAGDNNCYNMSWTGVTNNPTLRFPNAAANLNIYYKLDLDNNMSVDYSFAPTLAQINMLNTGVDASGFIAAVATRGKLLPNIDFAGTNGIWSITNTLNVDGELRVSAGRLQSGSPSTTTFEVNTDEFVVDGSDVELFIERMNITASTRFSVLDVNTLRYTDKSMGIDYVSTISTPLFEINSPNADEFGVVNITGSNGVINASGQSIEFFGDVNLNGTATNKILGSHTFSAVLRLNVPGAINQLEAGSTQTFSNSGDIIGTDANCGNYYFLKSTIDGSAAFISNPMGSPITLERFYFQDIHAVQNNKFSVALSIDLGNNENLDFPVAPPAANDFYWIGDSGEWSDENHWSFSPGGAAANCIPTATDNVFFDENSFSAVGQTVTVDLPAIYFNNMSWTDPDTDSPTFSVPSGDIYVGGSIEFASTMAVNTSGTIHFVAESGTQTITAEDNGGTGFDLKNIIFDGGATWTLGGALFASGSILLQDGTFDTNGDMDFEVEAGTIQVDGSGATLNLNDSQISAATFEILDIGTINPGESNILAQTFDITPDGLNFYEVLLRGNEGVLRGANLNFVDVILSNEVKSSVFGSHSYSRLLQFDKPGMIVEFEAGTTHEMGDLEVLGGGCGQEIFLRSSVSGSQVNFVNASVDPFMVSNLLVQDNAANTLLGALPSFIASNSQNLGNVNAGWSFISLGIGDVDDFYWIGGDGNWNDGSNWSDETGGDAINCIPTPDDNVFFDANSFTGPDQTVTLNGPEQYCRSMTWDGVTNMPTMDLPAGNSLSIYGSLSLLSGTSAMTLQFGDGDNAVIECRSTSTGNVIRTSGHIIPNLTFNGPGGAWGINGAIEVGSTISVLNGLLNTNGVNVVAEELVINGTGASLSLSSSSLTLKNKFDIIQINPANFNAGTSTITTNILESDIESISFNQVNLAHNPDSFDSSPALNGENLIFNSLFIQGTFDNYIFGSHQFNTGITFDNPVNAATTYFEAGSIQTLNSNASLFFSAIDKNKPAFIYPSGEIGETATFLKTSGQICVTFVRISGIVATGGARFGYDENSAAAPMELGWELTTDCETFLPVDCIDFAAAVKTDNSVELYWITAQEINNSGFEVQRSTDGRRFETIAWVDGAGTTSESQKYTYIDRRTEGFTEAYYRIKQIDFDGTAAFACDIQAVNFRHIGDGPLQVFPNPAGELIQVRWFGQKTGTTILRLFDQSGRLVIDREWSSLEGNNQRELPLKDLPKGIYELQLVNGNGQMQATRVVKQ